MRAFSLIAASAASLALLMTGCTGAQTETSAANSQTLHADHADHGDLNSNPEHEASLAKLSPEDRLLAEAQGYCAVTTEPLGSMGVPRKLMVNNQPVFVCCKGCESKALANPDKTLAKVEDLKAKVKSEGTN